MHAFVAALPPASSMGLAFYLLLIVGAAFAGGSSIAFLSLGHRRMQVLLSLTGGIMLGVGLLHLLPHAALELNGRLDDLREHTGAAPRAVCERIVDRK